MANLKKKDDLSDLIEVESINQDSTSSNLADLLEVESVPSLSPVFNQNNPSNQVVPPKGLTVEEIMARAQAINTPEGRAALEGDNGSPNFVERLAQNALQGVPFVGTFMDEGKSGAGSFWQKYLSDKGDNRDFQDIYNERQRYNQEQIDRSFKEHPVETIAELMGGGIAGGILMRLPNLVAKAPTLKTKALTGTVTGAGTGALYGAGASEAPLGTEENFIDAGEGAAWGAGIGFGLPIAGAGLGAAAKKGIKLANKDVTQEALEKAVDKVVKSPIGGREITHVRNIASDIYESVKTDIANNGQKQIPLSNTREAVAAINNISSKLLKGIPGANQKSVIKYLKSKKTGNNPVLNLEDIFDLHRGINQIRPQTAEEAVALKRLSNSIADDLEIAGEKDLVIKLREADNAWSGFRKSEKLQSLKEASKSYLNGEERLDAFKFLTKVDNFLNSEKGKKFPQDVKQAKEEFKRFASNHKDIAKDFTDAKSLNIHDKLISRLLLNPGLISGVIHGTATGSFPVGILTAAGIEGGRRLLRAGLRSPKIKEAYRKTLEKELEQIPSGGNSGYVRDTTGRILSQEDVDQGLLNFSGRNEPQPIITSSSRDFILQEGIPSDRSLIPIGEPKKTRGLFDYSNEKRVSTIKNYPEVEQENRLSRGSIIDNPRNNTSVPSNKSLVPVSSLEESNRIKKLIDDAIEKNLNKNKPFNMGNGEVDTWGDDWWKEVDSINNSESDLVSKMKSKNSNQNDAQKELFGEKLSTKELKSKTTPKRINPKEDKSTIYMDASDWYRYFDKAIEKSKKSMSETRGALGKGFKTFHHVLEFEPPRLVGKSVPIVDKLGKAIDPKSHGMTTPMEYQEALSQFISEHPEYQIYFSKK